MAGLIVEIRVTGDLDFTGALGDIGDAIHTAQALRGNDWPTLIPEFQARAREIVNSDWDTINRVADALLASSTCSLSSAEVQRIAMDTQ